MAESGNILRQTVEVSQSQSDRANKRQRRNPFEYLANVGRNKLEFKEIANNEVRYTRHFQDNLGVKYTASVSIRWEKNKDGKYNYWITTFNPSGSRRTVGPGYGSYRYMPSEQSPVSFKEIRNIVAREAQHLSDID